MDITNEIKREAIELFQLCPNMVLASSSPNRRALLAEGGISLEIYIPNSDENTSGLGVIRAMKKNAKEKLDCYLSSSSFRPNLVAISADTLVLFNDTLIGKPKERSDALKILSSLNGKKHSVYTGTAIYIPHRGVTIFCDKADVYFNSLDEKEILSYLDTSEWIGAAGGYRLQKTGNRLIKRIEGDKATVVGLPLKRIISIIQEARHSAPNQELKS